MSKRITIMIDDDLFKTLHELQAKMIIARQVGVSYSKVINLTLRKGLNKKPLKFNK